VAGRNGLYRSHDGGASFVRVLSGGRVTSLALGDGSLFAGTEADGIVRSADNGRTWSSANPGLLDLTVLALALSPGFGRDGTGFAATASGVYRTRNGARSWREVDLGTEVAVQCVAVSPRFAEDHLVLAGTESDGLFRSEDGGVQWEPVAGVSGRSVTALAFSQIDRAIVVATELGIGVSVDDGRTFDVTGSDLAPVLALACVPHVEGEVLLAGLHRNGVARASVHAGTDWTLANEGLHARLLLGLVLSPEFEVDHLLFAFGPDDGVLMSPDEGTTWMEHLRGPDDPSVFYLTLSPDYARDRTLYAATSMGVLRSRDAGATWGVLSGVEPSAAGVGAGASWQPGSSGVDASPARVVAAGPPDADGRWPLVAALANGRLSQSDDQGGTWRSLGDGFGGAEIMSVAFSPEYARDRTIFVGTTRSRSGEVGEVSLWRSVDAGISWQRWLVERGDDLLPVSVPRGYPLSGQVFVALGGRVLSPLRESREVRGGEQRPLWRGVQVGGQDTLVTALVTATDASQRDVVFAAANTGVYVSRDVGGHFTAWASGGPSAVVALAVSPAYARDRLVYALGLGGTIWRRRDL
ncbi:MAG TPA: hypothetical protein VGJ60_26905, partial [Chloroflexota bacterium]